MKARAAALVLVLILLLLALAILLAPGEAQQAGKAPRVGYIGINRAEDVQHLLEALRQGLRERGWVEGQTIAIDYRWAGGRPERLPELAAELVNLKVDLLVVATAAAIQAARNATRTLPIVMAAGGDPVLEGFVASLAQPGGNITGLTFTPLPEVAGKQLELLTQAIPQAKSVAVLSNPTNRSHALMLRETQVAARSLGVQVQLLEARYPDQIDSAFMAMARERIGAVMILSDAIFFGQRRRIVDLAANSRMPAMYGLREHVDAGGLMAYGPNLPDNFRRAASFIDRILKGANPAELPIEQPTKFDLVINLKTAKALGLTIPPSLLLRADQVIE